MDIIEVITENQKEKEFKELLKTEKHQIELIGDFPKNQRIKTLFKCNNCGNIYEETIYNVKRYEFGGCKICSQKSRIKTKTQSSKEIEERMIDNGITDIKMIGTYTKMKNSTEFECLNCGNKWFTTPDKILNKGTGCPLCARKFKTKPRITKEEFLKDLEERGKNFTLIGEYIGHRENTTFLCGYCNSEFTATPKSVLRQEGCINCRPERVGIKKTKPIQDVLFEINENNKNVEYIGGYINAHTKCLFKCKSCGRIFECLPSNIIKGNNKNGCSVCVSSMGERKIYKTLSNMNVKDIVTQKTFDDLFGIGNGFLRYDFYLPDYNLLIEYQGEQHERPIRFNGESQEVADEKFKRQKEHDMRKREYAKLHNIKLLEIWYWEYDNIEEILNKNIK